MSSVTDAMFAAGPCYLQPEADLTTTKELIGSEFN